MLQIPCFYLPCVTYIGKAKVVVAAAAAGDAVVGMIERSFQFYLRNY